MTILHALILGAVEGITEFLPISSTAHLMIAAELLRLDQSAFVKSFEIVIQVGAMCAVLFLYLQTVVRNPSLIGKTLAGFIPTAVVGFALYKFIKNFLLGNFSIMIWSVAIGGVLLIAYELWEKRWRRDAAHLAETSTSVATISYTQAATIGALQAVAVIPGVSRSAITIVTGRFLGLGKSAATEFSFLLALPTIAAAAGYDLLKNSSLITGDNGTALAVGFIAAFITALVAIRLLTRFVRNHSFAWFGVYRILLAAALLLFVAS